MGFRQKTVSCEEARNIDMVSYLSSLGHEPTKIRNDNYWYLSPLRVEKTASFKVNRKFNRWYDHGLGKGGNLIDFAILYGNCTVGEFLQSLQGKFSLRQPFLQRGESGGEKAESPITIRKIKPLTSFTLHRYLYQRRIQPPVAAQFCQEVHYTLHGQAYFAIGFRNDAGGYELRNAFFKGSSTPKDLTIIDNGADAIAVFEGFFDFLSFMSISAIQLVPPSNFLVLNSVSFFEKARPFLEKHRCINLYLDRDRSGQNCTDYALSLNKGYQDKSDLYRGYKDLNDWIINFGKGSPGCITRL